MACKNLVTWNSMLKESTIQAWNALLEGLRPAQFIFVAGYEDTLPSEMKQWIIKSEAKFVNKNDKSYSFVFGQRESSNLKTKSNSTEVLETSTKPNMEKTFQDELKTLNIGSKNAFQGKGAASFFPSPWITLNRILSNCEELVEQGASIGETPTIVIKKCKYTIVVLSDPAATLSIVFYKGGVLDEISNRKGYIDMSTVDADTSSKIGEAITKKGGYFLAAPVSGSKKPSQDGQLLILAIGEKALYQEAIPAFDVMGKKSFYLGEVGNEAKMKLVVNMIMGKIYFNNKFYFLYFIYYYFWN
ncbi:glyoxylate/succinic semialdehyde reductase 1-like [Aristolochia californica]|uniref:glyoxylate/succinic semialdehyde reductase 1-like n=1 Tax=Aristolochia californica TaxID=171875 RepID=UPI0035DFB94E